MDYKDYHDRLTDCFYNKKEYEGRILSKAEFDKLHALNWLKLEKEETLAGKISIRPKAIAEIDAQINKLEKG